MLTRRRLKWNNSYPIEAKQAEFGPQPEIAVGRLGNRGDGAFRKSLADPPRGVRVLADVERGIEREGARPHRQQNARQQRAYPENA